MFSAGAAVLRTWGLERKGKHGHAGAYLTSSGRVSASSPEALILTCIYEFPQHRPVAFLDTS